MRQIQTGTMVVLLVFAGCVAHKQKQGTVTDIIDARQKTEITDDGANSRHHNIKVYSVAPAGDAYSYRVYFYRNVHDSVKRYQANYGSEYALDKAEYKWKNDTLAAIRLYSQRSKKVIRFEVFGNENRTGINEMK